MTATASWIARPQRGSDWCILRTSPGRTLALAASLSASGIEAWTPARTIRRRRPRSTKTIEITVPIMPTFVFARAARLADLAIITALPISPHPAFSIFRHHGRIPVVSDRSIAGARDEEQKAKEDQSRGHRHYFEPGTKVTVNRDAFTGLEGVIEDGGDGRAALVTFGGAITFTISTFLLTTADLETPNTRAAA